MQKPIFVTQPCLPNLDDFKKELEKIWESKWITNNGEYHQRLERELVQFLNVKEVSLFTNATIALVVALKALRITGEVITTPYSFVATTHALHWNGIKPVFCDIREEDFNMDPAKIEALITPQTTAIMPVHVYGNPCDNQRIQKIADVYGLKVIYDAAHAFAVEENNVSILNWGDLSILSFHATKTFNTIEGGAIVTKDPVLKKRIDYLKNFGFADEVTVVGYGINGKMNELTAAYGLLQLKTIDQNIKARKKVAEFYREKLDRIEGITCYDDIENVRHNYTYFPVLVDRNKFNLSRDELYEKLKQHNIYSRRYFYPLISEFPAYRGFPSAGRKNLPVASAITNQILCLPIYGDLTDDELNKIINVILS